MLQKDTATAIFDRFDEAGMGVALRAMQNRVEVTSLEGHIEHRRETLGYEVEVEVESIDDPKLAKLLGEVVERFDAKLVPDLTSIKVR